MLTAGLHIVLLIFATVGFAGAGASLAVARTRYLNDGERDAGMLGVAGMLFMFGALCTAVGSGLIGVLAFGGVAIWVGYVVTAQRIGIFGIDTHRHEEAPAEEPHQTR
jgi:threonine/homoserine efflux transporter RhtA